MAYDSKKTSNAVVDSKAVDSNRLSSNCQPLPDSTSVAATTRQILPEDLKEWRRN